MGLQRITEPSTSPVTLAEAKTYLRVDGSADDTGVQAMIDAAVSFIEDYIGRSIVAQAWRVTIDDFADAIVLRRGPVTSITSVQYYDTAGALQTVSAADYTLDNASDPAFLVRNTDAVWPATMDGVNAVQINYATGYATIPAAIKHAVLVVLGYWFDNRDGAASMPPAAMALLQNHRAFA